MCLLWMRVAVTIPGERRQGLGVVNFDTRNLLIVVAGWR